MVLYGHVACHITRMHDLNKLALRLVQNRALLRQRVYSACYPGSDSALQYHKLKHSLKWQAWHPWYRLGVTVHLQGVEKVDEWVTRCILNELSCHRATDQISIITTYRS